MVAKSEGKPSEYAPDFEEVRGRVQAVTGLLTMSALAAQLGITSSAVADAKRRGAFPVNWAYKLACDLELSLDYILFGKSCMAHPGPTEVKKVLYIDPTIEIVEEAIKESGVTLNERQKKALAEILREELKSKASGMIKGLKGGAQNG